jgi:hypothetical protein
MNYNTIEHKINLHKYLFQNSSRLIFHIVGDTAKGHTQNTYIFEIPVNTTYAICCQCD